MKIVKFELIAVKCALLFTGILSLTACATTTFNHPYKNATDFETDKSACEYEALKHGQVPMWGTGVGAGIEQGLLQAKIIKTCLKQKGWVEEKK